MSEKYWADLTLDEWLALVGIAHHPQSWEGGAQPADPRRYGARSPDAMLCKLRDLGLIDYVPPHGLGEFATCTLTELGRQTLDEHNRRGGRASGH